MAYFRLLAILPALLAASISLADDAAPRRVQGVNIARGRPYTFSLLPARTWDTLLTELPNYDTVLTDGVKETSASFWVSSKCVSFTGATHVDICIDLGSVQPIAAIYANHSARPVADVFLPRKEEYFVSDDGARFRKAGEFLDTRDDRSLTDKDQIKARFFEGVAEYGIGPIKAAGRYVLVRTYGAGIGDFGTYVGYDEIEVIRGDFAPADALPLAGPSVVRKPTDLPADALGYRVCPPDWQKILRENPLYVALAPTQYLGDDEYHLSVGGVYALVFSPLKNTLDPISHIKFACELPASVELLSCNWYHKLTGQTPVERDGKPWVAYEFELKDNFCDNFMWHPFLIVRARGDAPGRLGDAYYRYSYDVAGKRPGHFERRDAFALVLDERLAAEAPKQFMTAFWIPCQLRYLSDAPGALDPMVAFYKSIGFNRANGGNGAGPAQAALFAAAGRNGMTVCAETGIANGLMISGLDIPPEDRFKFAPGCESSNTVGLCPTLMYSSSRYHESLKAVCKNSLAGGNDLYSNWEPYMFLKRGCACDRCKQEFIKFSGMPAAEADKLWPRIITDPANEMYNRFSSFQYGRVVATLQAVTREAGAEMNPPCKPNFVIAIDPDYFRPGELFHKVHDPAAYFREIAMVDLWSYPNTIDLGGFDLSRVAGNTLTTEIKDFEDVRNAVRSAHRFDGTTPLPRILFMQAEYFDMAFVMPKDYYFNSLWCFFGGMSGYGTFSMSFKPDARYLALHAKANNIISAFESQVLDGREIAAVKATCLSPIPQTVDDQPVTLLVARAFEKDGSYLVAVGNDYPRRVYVRVAVAGLPEGEYRLYDFTSRRAYQKEDGRGYSAAELSDGAAIAIPGKEWAVLQLCAAPPAGAAYAPVTDASLQKMLAADTPELRAFADELK